MLRVIVMRRAVFTRWLLKIFVLLQSLAMLPCQGDNIRTELLYSIEKKKREVEVRSFLADKDRFFAIIRENKYAVDDFSYHLVVNAPS